MKRVIVKRLVQSLLDNMILELGRGNRLEFRDFGVFETKERAPRVAQNPRTLVRVTVPAKKVVKFKVGRLMQKSLDEAGSPTVEVHSIGFKSDGHPTAKRLTTQAP